MSQHLWFCITQPQSFWVSCKICGQQQTTVLNPDGMSVKELAAQLTHFHRAHIACDLLDRFSPEMTQ